MKRFAIFAVALPMLAGNVENFTDISLNYTQRNEACFALRGDKSPEAIEASRVALTNVSLQACAGTNLRIVGAFEALQAALTGSDSSARAVAARELGSTGDHRFIAALRHAANDGDLLVASNTIEGLARYEDHASAPQLREIAMTGGVLTSLALNTLIEWKDPEILAIARKLVSRKDPGDQLTGIRVIAQLGDKSDLPKLEELAKNDVALNGGARGFGLMPPISISRAARTAIDGIQKRS